MTAHCSACTAKDLQIIWLKQRIIILQREIKRLKRIIKLARVACEKIISEADWIMSEHQPRAKWAYAKAAKTAAQTILSMLG